MKFDPIDPRRQGFPTLFLALVLAGMAVGVPSPAVAECTEAAAPGANWRRCFHDGRIMPRVDLTGAMLRDATFQRSDLSGSTLTNADAYRAKFVSAILNGVIFDGARLTEVDFTRADLAGASLRNADLRAARLVNADLRKANLTGARLDRADLRNAELAGAIWTDGVKVCAEGSVGQCN
ncbi:Pentapeptide repeat family protein [uncultured Gammaproteobacteria bacterium]